MKQTYHSAILAVLLCGLLVVGCKSSGNNTSNSSNGQSNANANSNANSSTGGSDGALTFDATHAFTVTVPEGAQRMQLWLARPQADDPHQEVVSFDVDSPWSAGEATDNWGNTFVYFDVANPEPGEHAVVETFRVKRREVRVNTNDADTRPLNDAERSEHAALTKTGKFVVIDDRAREIAAEVVGDEKNPMKQARLVYDWVLNNLQYWVKDQDNLKSSGTGSSTYAIEQCTGNCTDIHAAFAAVARAAGLPCRAVYGSFFKKPLDGVDKDQSYHCWIEFFAPGIGWVPLDVALADLYTDDFDLSALSDDQRSVFVHTTADGNPADNPEMIEYLFGNLDARRVVWHRGRDLQLDPPQAGDPLPWLPKAHMEIDGEASSPGRKFTFKQVMN